MATTGLRPSLDHFREPAVFIKVPEIVLLLVAVITFFSNNDGSPAYVASVLVPCLLNSLVFLTTYVLGYSQLKYTPVELALYTYYVLALFISSILLLSRPVPNLIASGVFCILLTIIYAIEMYFSYTNLVKRVPLPANNTGNETTQADHPQPSIISPPAYSTTVPPLRSGTDNMDRGNSPWSTLPPAPAYHTNPVYPSAMDYPPHPIQETTTLPPKAHSPQP